MPTYLDRSSFTGTGLTHGDCSLCCPVSTRHSRHPSTTVFFSVPLSHSLTGVPFLLPVTSRSRAQAFVLFRAKTDKGIVCLADHLHCVTVWVVRFLHQNPKEFYVWIFIFFFFSTFLFEKLILVCASTVWKYSKFQTFAQFLVYQPPHTVVPSFVLFLCKFALFVYYVINCFIPITTSNTGSVLSRIFIIIIIPRSVEIN